MLFPQGNSGVPIHSLISWKWRFNPPFPKSDWIIVIDINPTAFLGSAFSLFLSASFSLSLFPLLALRRLWSWTVYYYHSLTPFLSLFLMYIHNSRKLRLSILCSASNPSIDLSVMQSYFRCINWILSIMHMFWQVKRTCIQNVIHADMNNRELHRVYITSPYYGVPCVKISQYMYICPIFLSESLLSFWPFYWWPRGLFLSAFHFGITAVNKLKNGSSILPGKVSQRSDTLGMGKWTKCYDRPPSLKCKNQLAGVQPQENAGCWRLSPSPQTHTHRHENQNVITLFTFFGLMISSWAS